MPLWLAFSSSYECLLAFMLCATCVLGSPKLESQVICEQSCGVWESNLGPLQEQPVLLIAEPSPPLLTSQTSGILGFALQGKSLISQGTAEHQSYLSLLSTHSGAVCSSTTPHSTSHENTTPRTPNAPKIKSEKYRSVVSNLSSSGKASSGAGTSIGSITGVYQSLLWK